MSELFTHCPLTPLYILTYTAVSIFKIYFVFYFWKLFFPNQSLDAGNTLPSLKRFGCLSKHFLAFLTFTVSNTSIKDGFSPSLHYLSIVSQVLWLLLTSVSSLCFGTRSYLCLRHKIQTSHRKFFYFQWYVQDLHQRVTDNFVALQSNARLPPFICLVSCFCSSLTTFAFSFLQISSRDEHPCFQLHFAVICVCSGLAPYSKRTWMAHIALTCLPQAGLHKLIRVNSCN